MEAAVFYVIQVLPVGLLCVSEQNCPLKFKVVTNFYLQFNYLACCAQIIKYLRLPYRSFQVRATRFTHFFVKTCPPSRFQFMKLSLTGKAWVTIGYNMKEKGCGSLNG